MTDPAPPPSGPLLIDLAALPPPRPQDADPVPDAPGTAAMQRAAALAARPRSRLVAWFWSLAGGLVVFLGGLALYDTIAGLVARVPVLGVIAGALAVALVLVALVLALREVAAIARLGRLDRVQKAAAAALVAGDLAAARAVARQVAALMAGREETAEARVRVLRGLDEVMDADGVIALADGALVRPLDALAEAEVRAAARTVAAATALVPLPLADVAAALLANLRMIRAIALIYGGRSGTLGSWRLARAVLAHLVATGAVAVGEDLIGSVAGGSVLSKLSRRFGEGVVNGALTARVGVAAMEVCRPLPFAPGARPSVAGILGGALRGLFGRED